MQNGTHIPKTRSAGILLLAVILAAVAALPLHTGGATYAQTGAPDGLPAPALTATATGPNTIELRWNAVADAASYRLIVWDETIDDWRDIGGALTGTSYVHGGLTADTTYYFHIHAVAADGAMSKWSSQAAATTFASGASTPTATPTASPQTSTTDTPTPTPTPTSTPTASALSAPALTAEGGNGEITLRWDEVAQAMSYRLVVWDAEIEDWRDIGGVVNGTSYVHGGLTAGTTYHFHVRAVDAGGATSGWSSKASATARASALGTAPALTAETGAGEITLRWGAVAHAASYRLEVWDAEINDWRDIGGVLTGTSYVHGGLTAGSTYYFRIRAMAAEGATSEWSSLTAATVLASASDTPTPTRQAGTGLAAPALTAKGSAGVITLRWGAVAHAASYRLVVWDREINDWRDIGGVLTGTSYVHRGLTADTTYYFHIRTVASDGATSAWSSQASATTAAAATPTPAPTPATTERGALIALYEAAGGVNWTNKANWLSDKPLGAWEGVTTDANGRVVALNFEDNRLFGQIPDLSALTNLTLLDFSFNELSGEIPDLSAFSNLTELSLLANKLSGEIPDLSALSKLTELSLSYNDLSGPIPDLSALSNLETLYLYNNQLSGPIPGLNALSNLKSLNLSNNGLSGSISGLNALSNLRGLNLSHNQLSGTIFDLNHLPSLNILDLSYNQLSGPLPDLGLLTSLASLDLAGNRFCLPAGYDPSEVNSVVTAYLNGLNPEACTEAELEAVPQNLAAAIGVGQVTLTWDAVRNAAGYELSVWNSLDREWEAIGGALTATTYTHAVLSDGRNYYYQARARDANDVWSPWSERAGAIIVPARFPPPPISLGLHLYYQKYLAVDKVVVAAPTEVSDEKMEQARAIVSGMLSGKAGLLLENISGKYIRIAIYKQDEKGRLASQLPEYPNQYPDPPGVALRRPSGWIAVVPQEDPRCGTFIHEFAHAIHFAIEDQPGGAEFRSRLEALYATAVAAGLWEGHYASTNELEYWAETVRFWFQGRVPDSLMGGPAKLADYDPEAANLIVEVFGDASVPAACQIPPSENQS